MSANRYCPHVLVLPEDDANKDIAIGFELESAPSKGTFQVLPVADGWNKVLKEFLEIHVDALRDYPLRHIVLLIDFDDKYDQRFGDVKKVIPVDIAERVFVLGAKNEPEDLKPHFGPLKALGGALARDCRDGTDTTWSHALLNHNAEEVARLRERVRLILFR